MKIPDGICAKEDSVSLKAKKDLVFFCEKVLGYKLSKFHEDQLKLLSKSRYVCIISPRGHLKTTLFSVCYPLWKLWTQPDVKICLISSTLKQSEDVLEIVKNAIEESPILKEIKSEPWNKEELTTTTGGKYFIKPFSSTIRGTHVDYCICDDILRESNISQEQIKEIFWSIIYPIVQTRKGQLIIVGTPMTSDDLLAELAEKEGWATKRYSAMNGDGPLWPERFSPDELKKIASHQGELKFKREYLCEPSEEAQERIVKTFVGREQELEKINSAIMKYWNILVTGSSGIGKTSFLLKIKQSYENVCPCIYFESPKQKIIVKLCKELEIKANNLDEIESNLEKKDKPVILLIDDIQEATSLVAKEIAELMGMKNLIVIAAGDPKHEKISLGFKEKIELRPLNLEETVKLIEKRTGIEPNKFYARKIYWLTKGIPLAVTDLLHELEQKLIEGKPLDKSIDNIKPHGCAQNYNIDLFPVFGIIAIAYLLLAMRYVARAGGNTGLYLTSGCLGFVLLAMIRYSMYSRRKKGV